MRRKLRKKNAEIRKNLLRFRQKALTLQHISFNFYQEFNLYKERQDSSSSVFFWSKPNSIQDFVVILHS